MMVFGTPLNTARWAQDPLNRKAEKSQSSFNIPHRLSFTYLWQPFTGQQLAGSRALGIMSLLGSLIFIIVTVFLVTLGYRYSVSFPLFLAVPVQEEQACLTFLDRQAVQIARDDGLPALTGPGSPAVRRRALASSIDLHDVNRRDA